MPTFHYRRDGQPVSVTLDAQPDGTYRARLGERVIRVEAAAIGAGAWRLTLDGGTTFVVHAAAHGDQRFVTVDGEAVTLTRTPAPPPVSRRATPAAIAAPHITAPMTGQVRALLVTPGERVERGQIVAVLEAMKMEQRIAAPAAGTVSAVPVSVGQVVQRGDVLVTLMD